MIATREFSLSIKTPLEHQRTLQLLRTALDRESFRILAEVPFHREFEKSMGVRATPYTVLVIWAPFHAYRAVLSDRDGGLFVPFSLLVAEHENGTVVAAVNHMLFGRASGSLGVHALARELNEQIRRIFVRITAGEVSAESSSVAEGRRTGVL